MNTTGILRVAASRAVVPAGRRRSGGQGGQPVIVALCPAVFDRHVLSLDVAGFAQPLVECSTWGAIGPMLPRKPITGIAFCCASRARDAVTAPPTRRSNSRRVMPSPFYLTPSRNYGSIEAIPETAGERLATRPRIPRSTEWRLWGMCGRWRRQRNDYSVLIASAPWMRWARAAHRKRSILPSSIIVAMSTSGSDRECV